MESNTDVWTSRTKEVTAVAACKRCKKGGLKGKFKARTTWPEAYFLLPSKQLKVSNDSVIGGRFQVPSHTSIGAH